MRTNNTIQTVLPVDEATVQERSVSVKVLTIGAKQVTQSLYKQLVEESVIDYETGVPKGEIWGWVNLHFDCSHEEHFHVVWEKDGTLRKSRVSRQCKLHDHVRLEGRFRDLAKLDMIYRAIDGESRFYTTEDVQVYSRVISVNTPVSLTFHHKKWEVITEEAHKLLYKIEGLKAKEYIPIEKNHRLNVWSKLGDTSDHMGICEMEWEEKYQEIKDAGQLFIAVSGVWK